VRISGYPEELGPQVEGATAEVADALCLKPLDVPRFLATLEHLTG
jgi:hypothetical protein